MIHRRREPPPKSLLITRPSEPSCAGGHCKQSTSSDAQNLKAWHNSPKSERLGLREMERYGLVSKGFSARDFFVSFLIFQKRMNQKIFVFYGLDSPARYKPRCRTILPLLLYRLKVDIIWCLSIKSIFFWNLNFKKKKNCHQWTNIFSGGFSGNNL